MSSYQGLVDRTLRSWIQEAPNKQVVNLYAVWSVAPVLDAIYFARNALKNAGEIGELLSGERPDSGSPYMFDRPLQEGPSVPDRKLVLQPEFLDPDLHLFRTYSGMRPSGQAIDLALRVLYSDSPDSQCANVSQEEYARLEVSGRFFQRLFNEEEGTFSLSKGDIPSIFGTFSTLSAIRTYRRISDLGSKLPPISLPLHVIAKSILAPDFTCHMSDGAFGFKDVSSPLPCLSLTEQGLRTATLLIDLLGSEDVASRELMSQIKRQVPGFLRLVRACWSDAGGFRRNPDPAERPNLLHTRYALQLVRFLLSKGFIGKHEVNWLDPLRVLDFLDNCLFGWWFANSPGTLPSICSERYGLNVLKILYLLALNRTLNVSDTFERRFRQICDRVLSHVEPMVVACQLRDSSLLWAYPRAEALKSMSETSGFISSLDDNKEGEDTITEHKHRLWRESYEVLRSKYGVPALSPEMLMSLETYPGSDDFMESWRYFLDHESELHEKHSNRYIAISEGGVIAEAPTLQTLYLKLSTDYNGRALFTRFVPSETPMGPGRPRVSRIGSRRRQTR